MKPRKRFPREDLIAIPLCLLWAIGFLGWAFGTASVFVGSHTSGSSGVAAAMSAIVSLPMTLAKHLITLIS